MIWRDGGHYGRLCRAITNEAGSRAICYVWTKQNAEHHGGGIAGSGTEPYPRGEANFRLILQAPKMLEALEEIAALALPRWPGTSDILSAYDQSREIARATIAAVKGEEGNESD